MHLQGSSRRTRSASGTRATFSPSRGEWTRDRTVATAQRKASRVKTSLGKASLCLEKSSASSSAKRASKKALQHPLCFTL